VTPPGAAAPAEPPAVKEVSEPAEACSIATSTVQSELLRFIQLNDVVPCDFDQDGVVDLLALNHRVSTGYGFEGIGNGLFVDGPSFDLPFRPAAAACVGDPLDNNLALVSTEGSIALFHPLVSSDLPTRIVKSPMQIVTLGGDEFSNTIAVVSEEFDVAEAYRLTGGGLTLLGEYKVNSASTIEEWYETVLGWTEADEAIPLPPLQHQRRIRAADLNCDGIPDVISIEAQQLVCHLSDDGKPLQTSLHVPLGIDPVVLKVCDVDGNGLIDILLLGSAGTLESVLFDAL